ncbi:MAG TPA: antibiotic biosynthesis monooxygenase [Rhodanobacteraceae bacterium]|nr:antibiotic biosynthesis monooxygenase [Rhodanobacteraceae bacterium]
MSLDTNKNQGCFIVLYRWSLKPGTADTFIEGWTRMTELLLRRGSLGSRLHRGSDGLWYSYAQWPSAQKREDIFALGSLDDAAMAKMRSAVAERFPEVVLDLISDYVVPLGHGGA